MRTWKDLEQDFRALHQNFDVHLDHQFGDEGERWEIHARSRDSATRFESLSDIAGSKVLELPTASDWPEVLEERDPKTRWYLCLRRLSGGYKVEMISTSTPTEPGVLGKQSYIARIDSVFAASATLCVKMDSLTVAPRVRLEALCGAPRYAGPCQQWRDAQGFLAAPEPNLAKAVADAVSAVEGLARIVLGDPKPTLGAAAQRLKVDRGLHPAIAAAIEKVWAGYASEVGGIRHGATSKVQVKPAEAHFAIEFSEAALRLLLTLDAGGS